MSRALILTAMSGYISLHNRALQHELKKAGFQEFVPETEGFFGAWSPEDLKVELGVHDEVIRIRGHWFTTSLKLVKEITAQVRAQDREDKRRFYAEMKELFPQLNSAQ